MLSSFRLFILRSLQPPSLSPSLPPSLFLKSQRLPQHLPPPRLLYHLHVLPILAIISLVQMPVRASLLGRRPIASLPPFGRCFPEQRSHLPRVCSLEEGVGQVLGKAIDNLDAML